RKFYEAGDVRRPVHDTAPVIERSRSRTADTGELAHRRVHRGERGPRALADRSDDVISSGARRRPLVPRDDPRDRAVVTRDHAADVRGPEVDAAEEAQTVR